MLVKIYWLLCSLVVVAALAFLGTGTLSMSTAVVLGFIAFGLTFMGMMSVLPTLVSHPSVIKVADAPKKVSIPAHRKALKPFGALKSA